VVRGIFLGQSLAFGCVRNTLFYRKHFIHTHKNAKMSTNNNNQAPRKVKKTKQNKQKQNRKLSKASKVSKKKSKDPASSAIMMAPTAFSQEQRIFKDLKKSKRMPGSEFIGTISGSVALTGTTLAVNPGNSTIFSWLGPQAQKWEQYRFHKLQFRYVTRMGSSSPGSVMISPDYNCKDVPPTTVKEALNCADSVESSTWREIVCVLNPESMFSVGPRKFVRGNDYHPDLLLYDACTLNILTVGQVDSSVIGNLWVDYDVEFFIRQSSTHDAMPNIGIVNYLETSPQSFTSGVASNIMISNVKFDSMRFGPQSGPGEFLPRAGTYWIVFTGLATQNTTNLAHYTITAEKSGTLITGANIDVDFYMTNGWESPFTLQFVENFTGSQALRFRCLGTTVSGTLSIEMKNLVAILL